MANMQSRSKWTEAARNIAVGEVDMVHEDNMPPQKWINGRISEVEVGADGRVRVAVVKTPNGSFRQAIQRLAPLPIDDCTD